MIAISIATELYRSIYDEIFIGVIDTGLYPDQGFVFLFDNNGRQVYDYLNRPVQVPEQFANSI